MLQRGAGLPGQRAKGKAQLRRLLLTKVLQVDRHGNLSRLYSDTTFKIPINSPRHHLS